MCGLCGIIGKRGEAIPRDILTSMTGTLRHRGPDDTGYFTDNGMGLGFCRLSVIDLSGGRQPMPNEDDQIWIVFNGEIYNYQTLRKELEATGRHRFKTDSDTETILHLYEEYGEDCLQHLRGMFAFAIWDKKKRRLFAARDRFGKKPFFYFERPGGGIVFASELKALLRHPDCPSRMDIEAINLYLSLQYIPAPKTVYQGVHKLPAAHALSWSAEQGIRTWRYWDIRYEPKETIPYEEAKKRLRERLAESVRLRMIADVPLGAFLSGGIDSSVVVALMAQNASHPIKTFSIGFEEEAYSEIGYAREVAERYHTDHTEFIVKPELIDALPKLAWHYSEPFADPSALPSYYLCRETRKHVTVALNGDGGDETFGGYLRYRALWAMERWNRIPASLRRAVAAAGKYLPKSETPIGWSWRLQRLLQVGAMPRAQQYGRALEYFHIEDLLALWRPEHRNVLDRTSASSNAAFEATLAVYSPRELLHRLMYLDLHHYLPDCLMVKMDIASMANSLETRSPFLDHVLVEEVARWPSFWKYRPPNYSKKILKETFSADLPERVRRRGKQGFGAPISQWFRGPLKGYLREILLSPNALAQDYFQPEVLKRFMDEHQNGARDYGNGLWALLMLELWRREVHVSVKRSNGCDWNG